MRIHSYRHITLSLLLILAFACGTKEDEGCELSPEILDQELTLSINRLEKDFFEANSVDEFKYLFEKHPEFTKEYLQRILKLPSKPSNITSHNFKYLRFIRLPLDLILI